MRLKEGYHLAKKCSGDVLTFLPGNSKDGTSDIDVRVIEVTLDGAKEYLATNLFDPLITQAMFQDLYFYRWPVETKYKELKSRLSLEEFSGATTVSVFQELFIGMNRYLRSTVYLFLAATLCFYHSIIDFLDS